MSLAVIMGSGPSCVIKFLRGCIGSRDHLRCSDHGLDVLFPHLAGVVIERVEQAAGRVGVGELDGGRGSLPCVRSAGQEGAQPL